MDRIVRGKWILLLLLSFSIYNAIINHKRERDGHLLHARVGG